MINRKRADYLLSQVEDDANRRELQAIFDGVFAVAVERAFDVAQSRKRIAELRKQVNQLQVMNDSLRGAQQKKDNAS